MTKEVDHPILQVPIFTLEVSKEFMSMAKANKYNTIEDIIKYPLSDLPTKNQSGYRMLRELLDILEANGLDHLIKD